MRISLGADIHIQPGVYLNRVQSDKLWKFAATEWHRLYKDYVPMKSGNLYQNVIIEPGKITHMAPYTHYAYEGEVFGPNFPIYESGNLAGFFSQPNRRKKKTGRSLKFSRQFHPKATRKWDKAAQPTEKPKLIAAMQGFIDGGHLNLNG